MKQLLIILLCQAFLTIGIPLHAENINSEVDELLYDSDEKEEEAIDKRLDNEDLKEKKINKLSGLSSLSPFSDIAIIQKKYLQKTDRWEFFPNLGVILNDAFFVNNILSLRTAYHLSEQTSIEINLTSLNSSNKQITDDIVSELSLQANTIVSPTSYYGADYRYTPFYGKMAYGGRSIIPYETYLSLGGGLMATNQDTTSPTAHLGLGQSFAMSKGLAVRWDASFYWYDSAKEGESAAVTTNIHLTVGASFFFPEAVYR